MRCYYDGQDAVGVCKHCGRGVCQDSGATVGKSLACKGRCEDEVSAMNDLMTRGRKAYPRTAGIYLRYAVVPGLLGLLSLGYAIFQQQYLGPMTGFFFGMGLVLLVAAGLALFNARRFQKP